jgi:hypothetical protein
MITVMGFGRDDLVLELYVILLVDTVLWYLICSPFSYFIILLFLSLVCLSMACLLRNTTSVGLLCQLHTLLFLYIMKLFLS